MLNAPEINCPQLVIKDIRAIYKSCEKGGLMKNVEDLRDKALEGRLSKDEIAYVAQKIKDCRPGNDEDLGDLIYILGAALADEHRTLIEKFLYYPTNPWITRQALHTLCSWWCLTKQYLDEVNMFIRGVEWDVNDDVRFVAISIAGDFLRENFNRELLQLLIRIFEDLGKTKYFHETDEFSRELIQSAAYEALARAMGKEWEDIPDPIDLEKIFKEKNFQLLDLSVLQKAHQLLQRNSTI